MARILREDGRPMRARELALAVNAVGRYQQPDGSLVSRQQIVARANKYPEMFIRTEQGLALRGPLIAGPRSDKYPITPRS